MLLNIISDLNNKTKQVESVKRQIKVNRQHPLIKIVIIAPPSIRPREWNSLRKHFKIIIKLLIEIFFPPEKREQKNVNYKLQEAPIKSEQNLMRNVRYKEGQSIVVRKKYDLWR